MSSDLLVSIHRRCAFLEIHALDDGEHNYRRADQHAKHPFLVGVSAKLRDQHKHTQGDQNLSEVCNLIGKEREFYRVPKCYQGIPEVDYCYASEQK